MNPGELAVRIAVGADGVRGVECVSTRPRVAHTLLRGRAVREVPMLLGQLFAVCGQAQSTASHAACEAAGGAPAAPTVQATRDRALANELVQEHLWHFLIDLPKATGTTPLAEAMALARKAAGVADLAAVAERHVFGLPPAQWAQVHSLDSLGHWCRQMKTPAARRLAACLAEDPSLGDCDIPLMDETAETAIAAGVFAPLDSRPGFAQLPHWSDGRPRETGALARLARHPLVVLAQQAWGRGVASRHLARLLELAGLLAEMARGEPARRHGAVAGGAGVGYAWAHTARGLLVHRAELARGHVESYDIVAPTEWNFHPCGAFVAGVRGITARHADRIAAQARSLAASLDPCVGWRVEVANA